MPDVHLPAVLVATIVVFVLGWTYNSIFGERLTEARQAAVTAGQPPPWKLAVEVLRGLILAVVVAGLASQGAIDEWTGGLLLGLALWIGFPLVLWTGALIWENTPSTLAVIHAGDSLVKLLVVGVIVSVWQ